MATPAFRFAPSPTGLLHVGNARSALFNALYARRAGGRFVLRLDDTDRERARPEFADAIREDLAWLGLAWDAEVRQSARTALYDEAKAALSAAGRLYPCFETEAELEAARRRARLRHAPPIYDRAALALTPAEIAAKEAEGARPYWRFKLNRAPVAWDDGVRGRVEIDTATVSDPVVMRADGAFLYTFTSVVDDADLAISDVVRGEDHVTNTAVQIELFEALGRPVPRFAHHNLLMLPSGEGLSKRLGHLSLWALREAGHEPLAVAALAVLTGTSAAVAPVASLEDLAERLAGAAISTSPARFDPAELDALTARTLHHLPYEAVAGRLAALGVGGGAPFWRAVQGNLARFAEAAAWWQVVAGEVAPGVEDPELLTAAAARLPPEPWDETTWGAWTKALAAATGRKGRALYHPLRLALTGRETGPELKLLLPLIGRERAAERLGQRTG